MKRAKSIQPSEVIIPIEVEHQKEGDYLATSRVLPGLIAQGRTMAEAIEIAQDVARKLIESYLEHGDPLPKPLQKLLKQRSKSSHFLVPVVVSA